MMMKSPLQIACILMAAAAVSCSSSPPESDVAAPPVAAALEASELIGQMRDMAWAEDVDAAEALIEAQRPHHDIASPEWLVAHYRFAPTERP